MANPYVKKKKIHIDGKVRLNMRVPIELDTWLKDYARRNNTTVTAIILQYFGSLKEAEEARRVDQI